MSQPMYGALRLVSNANVWVPLPAAISRLPPEILTTIFEFTTCVADHDLYTTGFSRTVPCSQLCTLARVCKEWNTICYGSPRLWKQIFVHYPVDLATIFVARSKSVPLSIYSTRGPMKMDTLELCLQYARRLEAIEVEFTDPTVFPLITGLMELPSLETMTLMYSYPESSFLACLMPPFASAATPRKTPSLRHLSLSGCFFPFDSPFFCHLRTLRINSARFQSTVLSASDLLNCLRTMPHLETLQLIRILHGTPIPLHRSTVVLPSLKTIHLECQETTTLYIIQQLTCPYVESIILNADSLTSGVALSPIVAMVDGTIPHDSPACAKLAMKFTSSSNSMSLSVWPNAIQYQSQKTLPLAPFRLHFMGPNTFEIGQVLCSSLPPGTSLFLESKRNISSFDKNWDETHFRQFLCSLHNVERARVHNVDDFYTLIADIPRVTKKNKNNLPPYSLPSLSAVLVDGHFSPNTKCKKLLIRLKARKAAGAQIRLIKYAYERGYFSDDLAELFAPYVNTVKWEGD